MGLGLNNSLKYSLLMDSRNGWYYVQRIAVALSTVLAISTVQGIDSGAKGFSFLYMLFYGSLFLITFISCSVFGDSITEEKEQGILPLVMMTGTSPASYLTAKFCSKTNHMFSLLFILLPPTLFAVTMGGVTSTQVIFLYIYLTFWFFFCGSICFWLSVLFSEKKEVIIISIPFILILSTLMSYTGISPFQRINFILNTPYPKFFDFKEFLMIVPICLYLFWSSCQNLQYGVMFPIRFMDEYKDRIKSSNLRIKHNPHVQLRKKIRFMRKNTIKSRDEFLIPVKSLFGDGLTQAEPLAVIVFIITLPFMISLFISWLILGSFILVWLRVVDVFSLEIEENTFTSLFLLPMSAEELLAEKIKAATPYMGVYLVYGLFAFPLLILALAAASLNLTFLVVFAAPLYMSLIYITILVTLRAQDMLKVTSFTICFFIIILYITIPYLSIIFLPGMYFLKKACVKEMTKLAEISD